MSSEDQSRRTSEGQPRRASADRSAEAAQDRGRSESDSVSRFECVACGTEHDSADIDYDRLGYPVCPDCGAETGPLATDRSSLGPARWRGRRVRRRAGGGR